MKKRDENNKIKYIREIKSEKDAALLTAEQDDIDDDGAIDNQEGQSGKLSKRITLGGLILVLFLLLYIPSLINWLTGNNVTTDIINIGKIEDSINSNGIIIRDEVLLDKALAGGRYIPLIPEGEKTKANYQIASILGSGSDIIMDKIDDINSKVLKARMDIVEKTNFFSEDLKKLDAEILQQSKKMAEASNNNDLTEISRCREKIRAIIDKKAEIIGENATNEYIDSLEQEKALLKKQLGENTTTVVSKHSGIVSYKIDGLETSLATDSLEGLSSENISKIIDNYTYNRSKDEVEAGGYIAKIIKGTDIYIASVLKTESSKEYEIGDKITIRINDIGIEASGTITNKNVEKDGNTVLVVKISRGLDLLSAYRVVNIDIIKRTEEGLKVPLRCLRDISKDSTTANIMLVKYNVADIRKVNIICKDDEYAIISTPENELKETVNLYDIFVINPDKAKEGDIIEK